MFGFGLGEANIIFLSTQLNGVQTNLFGMSNNEIDIHMSTDSKDEETATLISDTSDDSKESTKDDKKDDKKYKNDEFNDYEIDDRDPLKNDDMDDREW